MKDGAKAVIHIWENLFDIVNKNDTKQAELRCLKFLAKYEHVCDMARP